MVAKFSFPQMHPDWRKLNFWKKAYAKKIEILLRYQEKRGIKILPPKPLRFNCFWCKPTDVRVVILGQDPYPTPGHAHGLAFSVPADVKKLPVTLRNVLAEYQNDLGFKKPSHGNLRQWRDNGVLLLNSCLTVEKNKPNSHENLGWGLMVKEVFEYLGRVNPGIVYLLWGTNAHWYGRFIDKERNLVIESSHPSFFSAAVANPIPFIGSKPFSKSCEYLKISPELLWKLH